MSTVRSGLVLFWLCSLFEFPKTINVTLEDGRDIIARVQSTSLPSYVMESEVRMPVPIIGTFHLFGPLGSHNELCGHKNLSSRVPSVTPQLESRTSFRGIHAAREGLHEKIRDRHPLNGFDLLDPWCQASYDLFKSYKL